ncbi:MAG: glucose-1-phosphate cytidylyltransferase [Myxococcaceae bacterium]|nr:glucose-1-phosphate cytidylyltransferase [Myxococcaceae bacterium]
MKVVILAGGMGTRLSEETDVTPKPMVEIGGRPILWHIMNIYGAHGFREFVLALGYKQEVIKQYFLNFRTLSSDISLDLETDQISVRQNRVPPWKIHLVDTGLTTQTGGRAKRLKEWIGNETFMLTYGDGVANVDISALVAFHKSHGKLATVTAVRPAARFGEMKVKDGQVLEFREKPQTESGWINGGFFVLEPRVLDFIDGDATPFELDPMTRLVAAGELMTFEHRGFWQPMDTLRDKRTLESLWNGGHAPWRVWE